MSNCELMSAIKSANTLEELFFSKVLRWRYAKVLIITASFHYIVSSVFCNLFQLVVTDGIFNPFIWINRCLLIFNQPFKLVYGAFISILPFICLTKLHISSYSMKVWVPAKRVNYFGRIFHPKVLAKSFVLTVLCGYLSFYYASLAHPSVSVFSKRCPIGDNLCLNHQPFVVVLFGILFGIQLSLLYFTNNRNVISFTPGAPSFTLLMKLYLNWRFLLSSSSSFNFGIWTIFGAAGLYMIKGILYYDCLGVLIGSKASAAECLNLFSLTTDVSLWLLLVLVALLLSFIINVFLTLFREIVTRPLYLNLGVEEVFNVPGDETSVWNLSNGLQSKCELLRLLAFRHLRDISNDSSPWGVAYRKKAFAISQPGGHPHNWRGILQPTLALIKEFSIKLQILNNPNPSCKVFHVLDGGINSTRTSGVVAREQNREVKVEKNIWVLRQRVLEATYGLLEIPLLKFFVSPLPDAKYREVISDGQAVIWAVQGLSHLVSASYSADEYGVVQRDIVDIVTSLIQLQQVLDQSFRGSSMRVGIGGSVPPSIDAQLRKGLRTSIRMAIYSISNAFKDRLRDLSLPDEVRGKVESYLTFQEG